MTTSERDQIRDRESVRELLSENGGLLTEDAFAERLGKPGEKLWKLRQKVRGLRQDGLVLFIQSGEDYLYPAWQIHYGEMLPGLDRVLPVLSERSHRTSAMIRFFLSGSLHAADKSSTRPLDLLRRGEVDRVLLAARLFQG